MAQPRGPMQGIDRGEKTAVRSQGNKQLGRGQLGRRQPWTGAGRIPVGYAKMIKHVCSFYFKLKLCFFGD